MKNINFEDNYNFLPFYPPPTPVQHQYSMKMPKKIRVSGRGVHQGRKIESILKN